MPLITPSLGERTDELLQNVPTSSMAMVRKTSTSQFILWSIRFCIPMWTLQKGSEIDVLKSSQSPFKNS